jgi:hypothetical protein
MTASLKSSADGTQAIIQVNGVDKVTIPSSGPVKMPGNVVAFSAYQSVAQTVSPSTWTKVNLQSEEFDTTNAFDSTTNYRFQPTIVGYYQITGAIGTTTSTTTRGLCIYKNGTFFKYGDVITSTGTNDTTTISTLVYLNGTTDYLELWAYFVGTTPTVNASNQWW